MVVDWVLGIGVAVTASLVALGSLFVLAGVQSRAQARSAAIFTEGPAGTTFLFDGDTLVDATPDARVLIAREPVPGDPWARLVAFLSTRFPGVATRLETLADEGRLMLTSDTGVGPALRLDAELRGGLTRITLSPAEGAGQDPASDPILHGALQAELTQLRSTVAQAPILIWREREDGDVVWANTAYLLNAAETLPPGQDLTWPLPRLFDRMAGAQGATGQRGRLDHGGGTRWYDLVSVPERQGRLMFGLPADAAAAAESSLRDFMQTLTKTFAHLPIGLAIFDRQRQLALFNPALLDLTGLPPDLLSMRPTLFAFLDAMRDRNMIPEPKDYRSWRKQMTDLEKAASSDLFEDTWTLPSGLTYRVTGRPHPNGALALMFEDISTEMSRTRRYRADLELGQSVIDAMDEAIAVFSRFGVLVLSNAAYARLWGHDPATSLEDAGITALSAHWRSLTAPTALWTEAESFVTAVGDRAPWQGEARLSDGRLLECRFKPVQGGATLASFRIIASSPAQGEDLTPDRLLRTA